MNTFLMWLGGLLIAIFALLFAGPYFVDWNSYRGVFEEEATRVLGRRVRVGGSVNVRLLPAPYLLFEDLRISDTTGIAGAPLFKTDSFKMWLAVPPLLKGAFEANKVELQHPVLALASDAKGAGNWRTLLEVDSLPFVPTGVKLDSVVIEDGVISYSVEDGGVLARVENITGELTAQALAGPYSFRGTANVGGKKSDVRLITTEAGSDGSFRVNTQLTSGKGADSHKFDGYVRGFWDLPSVDGQLVSKSLLAGATSVEGSPLIAEVRSEVVAKGQSLDLNGLTISFNDFAQPQIVTGSMKAEWARRHRVGLELSSRWLDVDLMSGTLDGTVVAVAPQDESVNVGGRVAGIAAAPLPTARALITRLLDVFPDNTDVKARLQVDQVNLGGDRVGGLVVAMERAGGPLQLQTLRAILPGGARLNFSGFVEVDEGEPVFEGDLFIGGVSAEKIIHWAVGSDDVKSLISDGPFSVGGRMQLGSNRVMLKSAVAEFSGVPIRGGMVWDDGRKSIDLDVEGYEIDTRWFGLGKLEMPALAEVLSAASDEKSGAVDGEPVKTGLAGWINSRGRDLKLDLSAGRLTDGTTTLHDVEAKLKVSGGRIDINELKLVTEEGLSAQLKGSLDGVGKTPKGGVDYLISAKDRGAAWKLADLWAGDAAAPADRDRFAAFAPIRIAGRGDFGSRLARAADFTFDGMAGGGRVAGQLLLDGGIRDWKRAPVDLVVRSQSADTGQLFESLSGASVAGVAGSEADAGNLLVKAAGVPEKSLFTMMTLDSPRVSLVFDGRTEIGAGGVSALSGELQLRDGDIRKLLRLAGLNVPRGVGNLSYDGLADITWTPERFSVTPRDVNFGGARVAGRVALRLGEDGRRRIDGRLVSDVGSLPRMLSGVLSEPNRAAAADPVQVARAEGGSENAEAAGVTSDGTVGEPSTQVFSDRAFDLSVLEGVEGRIEFKAGKLDVGAGMSINGASGQLSAAAGKLVLDVGGRQAIGGEFKASLEVEKAAAGAVARGTVEIANADLAALPLASGVGGGVGRFGSGLAGLKINFEGRGLSPRGLISVMKGKGRLRLAKALLAGLAPGGVREVAETTLMAEEFSTNDLKARLAAAMGAGELPAGDRELALEVADGAVQVAALDVGQEGGRTRVLGTFDLRSFVFDSEWRVVAEDPAAGRPWPPVVVNKVGPVQKLGALEARLTSDALERELAVRKMERNVKELERLRQLDEEAAARQRERERQLELESQRIEAERAAAAAAAAGANSLGVEEPPAPLPDGWTAKPKPLPEGANISPDSGAQSEGGAAGQEGTGAAEVTEAPSEAVLQNKRVRRKTRRKRKPEPSFPNQIFGF